MLLSVLLIFNTFNISGAVQGIIWSNKYGNFQPIFEVFRVASFFNEIEDRTKIFRDVENHNFHKARITVAYFQENNLVNFLDNDTRITGVCGDVWTTLSEHLNFTLVPLRLKERKFGTKLPNGTYDGLLGLTEQNMSLIIPRAGTFKNFLSIVDYTLPLWKVRYYLYIKPNLTHDEYWMFHLFTARLWCAIICVLLVLCVMGYVYEKYANQKQTYQSNFQDHLLCTIAFAFSQGSLPSKHNYKSKIICITTSLFSWLIINSFNSNSIFLMKNKKYVPPFTNIQNLLWKTNYKITISVGSMVQDKLITMVTAYSRRTKDINRVILKSSTNELFRTVCFSKTEKLAAFQSEDIYKSSGKYVCTLVHSPEGHFKTWIASAVRRKFKYKRTFDNGILKLIETGILDALMNRWMNWKENQNDDTPLKSIDIGQVYMIFNILFAGFILSIIILLIEQFIYFRRKIFKMYIKSFPIRTSKMHNNKRK